MLVYVDDIFIAGQSEKDITEIKSHLDKAFTIKDLGYVKYFMGLQIARSETGLFLHQKKYLLDIIQETGCMQAKLSDNPLPQGLKLDNTTGPLLTEPDKYRRLIGKLLYLGVTRPDISYATQHLSQFMQ